MSDGMPFALAVPTNYRDHEVLAFWGRDPEGYAEQLTPTGMRKGCLIGGKPVALTVERHDREFRCQVVADGELSQAERALLHQAAAGLLGLRIAPEPFEAAMADDPWLGPLIRRQAGLRIPQTATAFEALTWAIIGQQINVSFAVTLRRTLIRLADRRHSSGLFCYPDAAAVAGLSAEILQRHKFSQAKAEALLRVARLVQSGELPLDAWQDHLPAEAESTLLAIKGVGPWTVNYTLLRGFGVADCSLHGDAAIKTALHRLTGGPAKPDTAQAQRLLERYKPYRSLAAAHLWASLTLAA